MSFAFHVDFSLGTIALVVIVLAVVAAALKN